ncbi:MAG: AbrB/MazE/SpoVT family DNA-binding domain-containing protein [Bacillota bacterium]
MSAKLGIIIVDTQLIKGVFSMRVKVQKWGNSIALRIPKSFAIETSLENGSTVNLSLHDGKLIIEPVAPEEYNLENLLSEIKETNIHKEYSDGKPIGKELW